MVFCCPGLGAAGKQDGGCAPAVEVAAVKGMLPGPLPAGGHCEAVLCPLEKITEDALITLAVCPTPR